MADAEIAPGTTGRLEDFATRVSWPMRSLGEARAFGPAPERREDCPDSAMPPTAAPAGSSRTP
jgi:hypothetical protein